jgi:hypothetical protein
MPCLTASVRFSNATPPPSELHPIPARVSTRAFWRKQLILRRDALECQWRQLFPQHDFGTGRLIRRPLAWDDGWRAAARLYHEDEERKGR